MIQHVILSVCFVFALGYLALARKLAHFPSTNIAQLFVFRNLFSFPLHTYLVDIWPLMNGSNGNTRPPLHIGASRIVDFPSGTSSAEFLIASRLVLSTFHCDHCFAQCHEEEIRIALFLLSGSNIKVFLVE